MKDTDSVHHHTLYILLHMIYYVMFFELQMVTRSFLRFPYRNFFFAPISVVYGTSETLTGANHGRYPLIILDLSLVHHLGCNIFVFTWSKLDFSVPRGAILGKWRYIELIKIVFHLILKIQHSTPYPYRTQYRV